jgi:UPF0716 protein FxsA
MGLILLLVLGLPIAEIAAFVEIGGRIGLLATLLWIFAAGVAGIAVIRLQGIATALQLRAALARNELPARTLFEAACVAVAGFLLLIPGFVSDAIAVLLLLPPVRRLLLRMIARRISAHVAMVRTGQGPGGAAGGGRGVVIEGEFSEVGPEAGDAGDGPPRRLPPRDESRDESRDEGPR